MTMHRLSDPPYSGVIHSGEVAGYTGAEGYTGVVPVAGSGKPADAPVSAPMSEKSQPLSDETLAREFGILRAPPSRMQSSRPSEARPGRTQSAADAALMERGEAPGQDGPLDYLPPPPLVEATPEVDDQAADVEDVATTEIADRTTADRALALAQLAASITNAQQRHASQPEPTPNRALEVAKALLQGSVIPDLQISPFSPLPSLGLGPTNPYSQDLLGAGADALRQQAATVVAATRPSTLGIAYLQGVGLGLFDWAVGIAEGLVETAVDPLGSALRQSTQIMQQIDERIAQGESPWEAANAVLNPLSRLLRQAAEANALEAAPHDWDEAIRLSREAGRAVASAGIAAGETAYLLRSGVRGLRTLRNRPPGVPPTPPATTSPPAPPTPPRPPGQIGQRPRAPSEVDPIPVRRPEANGVTGKVYWNGPQRLPSRPLSTPHPANPALPVYERGYIQGLLEQQKGMPDAARRLARQQQQARSSELRRRFRAADTKQIYNELERRTALESAVAQPDHAFLTQVEIQGVTLSDGTPPVPIERINRRLGRTRGRIADYLDVAPDGTYTLVETKQWWELYGSYSKRGGVTGSRINPSSRIGGQLRRETNVFDYARRRGGVVNFRGVTLDGRTIKTSLNPQNYRGLSPTPYDIIPGQ